MKGLSLMSLPLLVFYTFPLSFFFCFVSHFCQTDSNPDSQQPPDLTSQLPPGLLIFIGIAGERLFIRQMLQQREWERKRFENDLLTMISLKPFALPVIKMNYPDGYFWWGRIALRFFYCYDNKFMHDCCPSLFFSHTGFVCRAESGWSTFPEDDCLMGEKWQKETIQTHGQADRGGGEQKTN